MTSLRERVTDWALGGQKRQLEHMTRLFFEAYQEGPFEAPPEQLLAKLAEYDSRMIQDLVANLQWETLGGYDDSAQQRDLAIKKSQRMWRYDPLFEHLIRLGTNYGFGESISVATADESAQEIWDAFWTSDVNAAVLADDVLQELSNDVQIDGEFFWVYFISKQGGPPRVRVIPTEEIAEIITSPEDAKQPLFYKRVWIVNGESKTMYYPDWLAALGEDEKVLDKAKLPSGVIRADKENSQTLVVIQPVMHNKKSGNRGWPLLSTGTAWVSAHKRFREDRASVAAGMAMFIQKIKVDGGSRAVDILKRQWQSSHVTNRTTGYDTNPPPTAGSTAIENQAATLEKLPMSTGAGDAQVDGNALLMMACLSAGVFPHYAGAGEAFRLATACHSEDTEVLTELGWLDWRDWMPGIKIATYNHAHKMLEYQEPTKLHVYDYAGEMVSIQGRTVDALVTPNHKMLMLNENNVSRECAKTEFEIVEADCLPSRFALPTSALLKDRPDIDEFVLPGHSWRLGTTTLQVPAVAIDMDDWLLFVGWWIAEGSLYKPPGRKLYTVSICQATDSPYTPAIRELLERLPLTFCEDSSRQGMTRWRINNKMMYTWLEQECGKGAGNKHLPDLAFDLNARQARILLDAMWDGDGHWENQEHYRGAITFTSYRLIEECQMLMLHIGEWGKITLNRAENEHPLFEKSAACWMLHRNVRSKLSLARLNNVDRVFYRGKVWCFEVPPNGMFITRRNGCPLIAGNSAMERPILRNWSRYQLFWSAQFRRMCRIVLVSAEKFSNKKFSTYGCEVSIDRLIEVDLPAVTGTLETLFKEILGPGVESNLIPEGVAKSIAGFSLRMVLQALGAPDAAEMASDEALGVDGEADQEAIVALASLAERGDLTTEQVGRLFERLFKEKLEE